MKKQILTSAALVSLFIATAYASDEGSKLNDSVATPLCSISIYKENPALLVGMKFELKNGQFMVSNCSEPKLSFEWWELSRKMASSLNDGELDQPPAPPSMPLMEK